MGNPKERLTQTQEIMAGYAHVGRLRRELDITRFLESFESLRDDWDIDRHAALLKRAEALMDAIIDSTTGSGWIEDTAERRLA